MSHDTRMNGFDRLQRNIFSVGGQSTIDLIGLQYSYVPWWDSGILQQFHSIFTLSLKERAALRFTQLALEMEEREISDVFLFKA